MDNHLGGVESYFERRGHIQLAWMLLKDAVQQIADDPDREQPGTLEEIRWLRGQSLDAPIRIDDVFASLGIPEWAPKFADLAVNDPKTLRDRVFALGPILREMFDDGDPAGPGMTLDEGNSLDSYRDRARAV